MNVYCKACGSNTPLHEGGNKVAICNACGRVYHLEMIDQDPGIKLLGGLITLLIASTVIGVVIVVGIAVLSEHDCL